MSKNHFRPPLARSALFFYRTDYQSLTFSYRNNESPASKRCPETDRVLCSAIGNGPHESRAGLLVNVDSLLTCRDMEALPVGGYIATVQFLDAAGRNFLNRGFIRKCAALLRSQSGKPPHRTSLSSRVFEPLACRLCRHDTNVRFHL